VLYKKRLREEGGGEMMEVAYEQEEGADEVPASKKLKE
jgi:hypothetical protein